MKRVMIEPTLQNQSNDAYQTPHFSIKMVAVPNYNFTPNYDNRNAEVSNSKKLALKQ